MKKKVLLFTAIFMATFMYAQTNDGFNYKALVTNNGNPVANQLISVKVTLKQGSSVEWAEIHNSVQTDANGIFSIIIGEGTRTDGATDFKSVPWSYISPNITIEVNTGTGYTTLVNEEPFKYVPFSKHTNFLSNSKISINESINFWPPLSLVNDYISLDGSGGIEMGNWSAITLTSTPYLKINDNRLWINGELNAPDSGDADMKAYVYGFISSTGTINTSHSSTGFTAEKISTGKYKITFSDDTIDNAYVVVASADTTEAVFTTVFWFYDYFKVYIHDDTGSLVDKPFHFIVFRK